MTTLPVPAGDASIEKTWAVPALVAGAAGLTVGAAVLTVIGGPLVLVGVAGLLLVAATAVRPPLAVYLLIGLTPLIVGIDRGAVVPLLRPNEVLAVAVGGGVLVRAAWDHLAGHRRLRIPMGRLGWTLLAMTVASSVLPLLWLVARGHPVTEDDLLHALILWKYFGVFLLVRMSVTTAREIRTCLWVAIGAGVVTALVGILQVLQLFGVPGLLAAHYVQEGFEHTVESPRASSTLGSSLAMGDVMTLNLMIAVGWLLKGGAPRRILLTAAGVFLAGTLASGQFTAVIGLVVAAVVLGLMTGRLRVILSVLVTTGVVAGLALRTVILNRLSGFDSIYGLPQSWVGRWINLRTYFWPELFDPWQLLLGVRPSARLPAVETWREFIWIESGYTWLLWVGGIPLFASFLLFLWVALRETGPAALFRADEVGVAALAAFVGVAMLSATMILDPHLTLRGAGDLLFVLLALACARGVVSRAPPAGRAHGELVPPRPE